MLELVLIRQEGTFSKLVYYVSHVLHDVETKYEKLEKVVFALLIST